MKRYMRRITTMAIAALAMSTLARADTWNEKTVLTFNQPVMVPGVTLAPGSYVFRVADSVSARHVISVLSKDEQQVLASVQAVPMKRTEVTNDIVVQFEPTEPGAAPALKGWFYPGRQYGHQFVYPEEQARHIAERAKTVVLSVDDPGSDLKKGTLHTMDASGARAEWHGDEGVSREWTEWSKTRSTAGDASAALIQADPKGMRVQLEALEEDPSKYIGKEITVDGEVDTVLGPRVFKIDEPGWADLDGELLVVMPTDLAALVKEDDRVTVSGTVRQFVRTDIERELGWFDSDPSISVNLSHKPVIVASRIVGGDSERAMIIQVRPQAAPAAAGAGIAAAASAPIKDPTTVATAEGDLIGRSVDLHDAKVSGVVEGRGFFIGPRERQLFVMTEHANHDGPEPRIGQSVSVDGFVMQMPEGMAGKLSAAGVLNRHIYVYATEIQ